MQLGFPTVVFYSEILVFSLMNYLQMFTCLFENLVLWKYKFWLLHFSTDSLPLQGTIHPPLSAKMQ